MIPKETNAFMPFVEKYRPTRLADVILEPENRTVLIHCIERNSVPNMIFQGPPGTGKTTTIRAFVREYRLYHNEPNHRELVMSLNAADDRGVEVIRQQISQFATSSPIFHAGCLKFVILDEVDYMTHIAQRALRNLVHEYRNSPVRFCLICNYLSRIDESLRSHFVRLSFRNSPDNLVASFLQTICLGEDLTVSPLEVQTICQNAKGDIRAMLNALQHHVAESGNTAACNIQTLFGEWNEHFFLPCDPSCLTPSLVPATTPKMSELITEWGRMAAAAKCNEAELAIQYISWLIRSDLLFFPADISRLKYIVHSVKNPESFTGTFIAQLVQMKPCYAGSSLSSTISSFIPTSSSPAKGTASSPPPPPSLSPSSRLLLRSKSTDLFV